MPVTLYLGLLLFAESFWQCISWGMAAQNSQFHIRNLRMVTGKPLLRQLSIKCRKALGTSVLAVSTVLPHRSPRSSGPISNPDASMTRPIGFLRSNEAISRPVRSDPFNSKTGTRATVNNQESHGNGRNGDQQASILRLAASSIGSSFVRDATRVVGPSVVRVDCEREVPQMMGMFDTYREGDTVKVSGSGFVVVKDGYILTNSHVIEGAKRVSVTFSNGRTYRAQVVQFDELTDLAVLKADLPSSEKLSPAQLGDSNNLHSGDWVIAVGCPVGLDFTVTLGIVSNPRRSAYEVGAHHMKGAFIQTDAALNQGNSGGPLVNENGAVVGINTMVRTNSEAIGFAIPINKAMDSFEKLKLGKKPSHAYFGMEAMSLTPDLCRIFNDDPNSQRLPEVHGALVARVIPGSPAAAAGLRRNDIIVGVNGHAVLSADDADNWMDQCAPEQTACLRVIRGESKNSVITLNAQPKELLKVIEERRKRQMPLVPQRPPSQPAS
jgi:S1-C subfamily serine protease